jgi:crotonobetainyl-CoA:carnitine CoA-transferase CaiB-like acyl-CoA transferase
MSFTGEPGGGPMRYPIAIADMTCGMYSAMGILAALYAREKTGRGQFLDMALLDSQMTWLANVGSSYLNAKASPKRWGNAHPSIVPYEVFRGADRRFFVIGVGTQALWKRLLRLLEMESGVGQDERFRTNAQRTRNRAELIPLLQKTFDGQPASAWLEQLAAALIPAAPINTVEEAVTDTQILARNMIVELNHPALGKALSIGNPITFSETPVSYRLPPPLLGEHTSAILEGLGYTPDEVREMSLTR